MTLHIVSSSKTLSHATTLQIKKCIYFGFLIFALNHRLTNTEIIETRIEPALKSAELFLLTNLLICLFVHSVVINL